MRNTNGEPASLSKVLQFHMLNGPLVWTVTKILVKTSPWKAKNSTITKLLPNKDGPLVWMEMKILEKILLWKDKNSTITKLLLNNNGPLEWMVMKISVKILPWKVKNSITTNGPLVWTVMKILVKTLPWKAKNSTIIKEIMNFLFNSLLEWMETKIFHQPPNERIKKSLMRLKNIVDWKI